MVRKKIEVYELEDESVDMPGAHITAFVVRGETYHEVIKVSVPQWANKVYARLEIHLEG